MKRKWLRMAVSALALAVLAGCIQQGGRQPQYPIVQVGAQPGWAA